MTKYLLVDAANTFFRARHTARRGLDAWTKVGWSLHVTLSSINRAWRVAGADHVVIALEGRSWRKDYYEPYKKNRADARAALTETEQEEDRMFWETFDELKSFFVESTNCTVLRCEIAEADDLIARWIDTHPDDEHVIVSSDSDFYQLISKHVTQYNGINNHMITLDGVYDDHGKPVKDKKTGEHKNIGEPEWLLFEKCMRGDTSDNVFSAYPGVRTKGTKNKVGLQEAYEDRNTKGFAWNNLMLQRWTDHNGVEHRVLDDYNRNRALIDLRAQPDELKEYIDQQIVDQKNKEFVKMVGAKFMKFCGKYELARLSEEATRYAEWLNSEYKV